MTLSELGAFTAEQFTKAYGHQPKWIAAAPGRVNVIGEHTDYNEGYVLPMAIERYTVMAAAPATGQKRAQLRSTEKSDQAATIDLTQPLRPLGKGNWANYPAGVLAGFMARGVELEGFDAMIHSTVPMGGGLSSSATLEVSTATLLEAITGHKLDPVEKALLCQKAEHQFAGVPCGIMDQFISTLGAEGHLLLIDCRSRQSELIPMRDSSVGFFITNSNVKHALEGGEYAQRRAQCESAAKALGLASLRDADMAMLDKAKSRMDEVVYRRARHVITEIARTTECAQAIRQSKWVEAGKLMYASHDSMRDDYEISCAELDILVEIAKNIGPSGGVHGCRMTGGGFGGCTVTLVDTSKVEQISGIIREQYRKRTGIEAAMFVSRPAAAATVLQG